MSLEQAAFYHLQKTGVLDSLPALVDKIYGLGLRTFIFHQDRGFLQELDRVLWTYTPLSFIPHGVLGSDSPEKLSFSPVWLSNDLSKSDDFDVLVALSPYPVEEISEKIKRVVDMFDGTLETDVQQARDRWQAFSKNKTPCVYWTQSLEGKWEKTFERKAS
ncbi:MAG: hypothetical protein C0582_02485 [Alphaproteobacteria bacterium]|nr:MAG: hypothetical protein C0582_02485 [Alphaproteobacteria bacterium]